MALNDAVPVDAFAQQPCTALKEIGLGQGDS